jgi:succinate dehydrogenase/fumarate reductase flavoprotein subunit
MTITYGLMEKFETICSTNPEKARLLAKSRVQKLLTDESGAVYGCEYTDKAGKTHTEYGSVILCTGGFGADFSKDSLLMKYRPELFPLPTTNGDHCRGDGIKMACAIGGDVVDMERV